MVEEGLRGVEDDEVVNEEMSGGGYGLVGGGSLLVCEEGQKIFVDECEGKGEGRLGEGVNVGIMGDNEKGEVNG